MESISTTPVPVEVIDYTEALEDITYYMNTQIGLFESQLEVMQGLYIATLFVIGVTGAILVLLTLYNLIKKCY